MHQVEVATTQETLLDNPEMVLNMGPQHPSTHGVLRVVLRLDGETVIDLDCDIGFLHRGMEKIAENRLYPMIAPYWDRLHHTAAGPNGLLRGETREPSRGPPLPDDRALLGPARPHRRRLERPRLGRDRRADAPPRSPAARALHPRH